MNWFDLNRVAEQLLSLMADASVRALALAALAGVLALFLRRGAAARHAVWTAVLAGMLVLPVLRPVVPPARVVVEPLEPVLAAFGPTGTLASGLQSPATLSSSVPAETNASPTPWALYIAILYLAGVAFFAGRLVLGVFLALRLLSEARCIRHELGAYADLIDGSRVKESSRVRVPVTVGFRGMRIVLPAGWRKWPDEQLAVVLAHEVAHARRRDPLIARFAAVNRCAFWFHPLAWWLNRHLAALAEHAADDAAMVVSRDAENYARIVLEMASRMRNQGSRLIWHPAAMNGSLISRRIRRVLDSSEPQPVMPSGKAARVLLASSAVLLIWVTTAVDFQTIAHAQVIRPAAVSQLGFHGCYPSSLPRAASITAEEAEEIEQQLATGRVDEMGLVKLLHYYWQGKMHDRRIRHVLWLIDHHPESALHACITTSISPRGRYHDAPALFEDASSRWLVQAGRHPRNAQVLWNASRAFGITQEGLDLARRAQKLEPATRTEPLARIYSIVLAWSASTGNTRVSLNDPSLVAYVRRELQTSTDVALVGAAARFVMEQASLTALVGGSWDLGALRAIANELVVHAQSLEPENRQWFDLMEGVRSLPVAPGSAAGSIAKPGTALAPVVTTTVRYSSPLQ